MVIAYEPKRMGGRQNFVKIGSEKLELQITEKLLKFLTYCVCTGSKNSIHNFFTGFTESVFFGGFRFKVT